MPRTFTYPQRIIPAHSVMGYTLDELREYQPAAYARILHDWQDVAAYDCCESDAHDIRAAYDGLLETMGVRDSSGDIGLYRPNGPSFEIARGVNAWGGWGIDGADLTGARAMAWVENNLLSPLRREWLPITKRVRRWDHNNGRATLAYSWRDSGCVSEDAITGTYEVELIAAVVDSVRNGATVEDALRAMWVRACRLLETEHDYHTSEEYFTETHDGYYYDTNGDVITNV